MTPDDAVEIILSDGDFCRLAGDALVSEIVQNYGYDLWVKNVTRDGQRWVITYTQTKKKAKA